MKKKTLLQLLILIVIIVILIFFYKNSNQNKKANVSIKLSNQSEIINSDNSNLISNLKYVVEGEDGISYTITSEIGELSVEQPNLILMRKVLAVIKNDYGKPLKITADNAIYNNINHDTQFYDNVLMTYQEQVINSDNFDLVFIKNLATIKNNVVYKDLNTKLFADKVEINILTKNSKIFMYDKQKKIKIISIN
jgi:lipopolysaccharide export system protein LptA